MNHLFRAAVIIVLSLQILACTPIQPPPNLVADQSLSMDQSLVTGESCKPPCWHGLTPSESSMEEGIRVLQQLRFVDAASIKRTAAIDNEGYIEWRYKGWPTWGGLLFFSQETLQWLRVSYPQSIKLGKIVEVQGEPDWVLATRGGGENVHIFKLYYEDTGLLLSSRLYGGVPAEAELNSDIEIKEAAYYAPQSLNDLLMLISSGNEQYRNTYMNQYHQWPGFRKLIPVYDPPAP